MTVLTGGQCYEFIDCAEVCVQGARDGWGECQVQALSGRPADAWGTLEREGEGEADLFCKTYQAIRN